MAKTNKKAGNARSARAGKPQGGLAHEVWGLVFLATGLLVLMSLLGRYAGRPEVLGPIFGLRLSAGLCLLFGPVAAALVPLAIVAMGVRQVRRSPPSLRWMLAWAVLVLEASALLAVHNIGRVADAGFAAGDNLAGNTVTWLLSRAFGPHPLGPYFLLAVAALISVVVIFRTSAMALAGAVARGAAVVWGVLGRFAAPQAPMQQPDTAGGPPQDIDDEGLDAGDEPQEEPAVDLSDEERQRQLEEELAAFRARKDEPITITTGPTAPDAGDAVDEEEPDEEEEEPQDEPAPTTRKPDAPRKPAKPYALPDPDILEDPPPEAAVIDRDAIEQNSRVLEKTLLNFGVEGKVVNVSPGPVISRYEIELAPGIKVSRIVNLQDDIAMALAGRRIRIQAPIPGKAAVGIELPNAQREMVHFKHILLSDAFRRSKFKLPVVIGKSISGVPFVTDVTRAPHLLIAGQTGSGKSVCMNCFICSMLMTRTPEELRLIMIDPKKVELASYENMPHLLAPVVTEIKEAVKALNWGVAEMERRYTLLKKVGARDIESFNTRQAEGRIAPGAIDEKDNKPLPFVVIFIDELADLMVMASRDVETLIMRIAQKARAVGLHLIVATQRPSVDIITGTIKANLTSRIAFRTIQGTDSRTIIEHPGAEKLLGMGDMLFLRNGAPDIERYHGAFISEQDVERLTDFIRGQAVDVEKIESFDAATADIGGVTVGGSGAGGSGGRDELFEEAARLVVSIGQGSTSLLQRRMKIGFSRAGRLMDELHMAGIVGPQEGSKMREVRLRPEELETVLSELRGGQA